MSDKSPREEEARGEKPAAARAGAYRVLARKYRPKTFEELVGQEALVRTLSNAFESGRIAQGYMLTGVRGIGKTTTARLIARALNYSLSDKPTVHMPEFGEHCRDILESRHVDVIEMDAASHTSVDNIREIIEQVQYKPVSARYKVYIIDEVHMLSKSAFNALLKTLEEPPEHVKFIFATTEIRKVPVTVLSRCQRFDLRRVPADVLKAHLERICGLEEVEAEDAALAAIARVAEGSVRDSLSLLDQAIAYGNGKVLAGHVREMLGLADHGRVIALFEHLMRGDVAASLKALEEVHALGGEPYQILSDLAAYTHLVTRLKILGAEGASAAVSEEEREKGLQLAQRLSIPVLTRAWQMLLKGLGEVQQAAQALMAAEMVLIRIAHVADVPPPEELVRRLRGEGGAADSAHAPEAPGAPPASAPSASAPSASGPTASGPSSSRPGQGGAPAQTTPQPRPSESPAPPDDAPRAAASAEVVMLEDFRRKLRPRATEAADDDDITEYFDDLQHVVDMADVMRDIRLASMLRMHVRPVEVRWGYLRIGLTEDAPENLPHELAYRLLDWTGERWEVVVEEGVRAPTLAEQVKQAQDRLLVKAHAHPQVKALMEQFPEAKILSVRKPEALADDGAVDETVDEAAGEMVDEDGGAARSGTGSETDG